MSPPDIVQKLLNYCKVLRDDGMSYGNYVEQVSVDGCRLKRVGRNKGLASFSEDTLIPRRYMDIWAHVA
jgi:type I restriction enzyme M protein